MRVTAELVDHWLQKPLVAVYLLCAVAGGSAYLWQPPAMLDAVEWSWMIRLWALFLLGGGGIALIGTLMPRGMDGDWFGEFAGLPLIAAAVTVYGIVALSTLNSMPGRLCGACLLVAFGILLLTRWVRVLNDAMKERRRPPHPKTIR